MAYSSREPLALRVLVALTSGLRAGTAPAWALFYSLLGSAKLAGVEPKAYLRAMAYAAIRREELLLPHEWRRQNAEATSG